MSIIKEKVIASKSGNIEEARSLFIIMQGTRLSNNKEFMSFSKLQSLEEAIEFGNLVEHYLPALYAEANK